MGVYVTPNLVVASVLSGFFYGETCLGSGPPLRIMERVKKLYGSQIR